MTVNRRSIQEVPKITKKYGKVRGNSRTIQKHQRVKRGKWEETSGRDGRETTHSASLARTAKDTLKNRRRLIPPRSQCWIDILSTSSLFEFFVIFVDFVRRIVVIFSFVQSPPTSSHSREMSDSGRSPRPSGGQVRQRRGGRNRTNLSEILKLIKTPWISYNSGPKMQTIRNRRKLFSRAMCVREYRTARF